MADNLFPIGTKVKDKDGNRGTVIAHPNHYGKRSYTVEWFSLRFGQKVSNVGPKAVERMDW